MTLYNFLQKIYYAVSRNRTGISCLEGTDNDHYMITALSTISRNFLIKFSNNFIYNCRLIFLKLKRSHFIFATLIYFSYIDKTLFLVAF